MTQIKATTILLTLVVTFSLSGCLLVTTVQAPAGPSYTLGASPSTLNEGEGNAIITTTITGGTTTTAYIFRFTWTKPGGARQAYCDEAFLTDSRGGSTQ